MLSAAALQSVANHQHTTKTIKKEIMNSSRLIKAAVLASLCGVAAFATTVTYTTAGVFASSGTNTTTSGGDTIVYSPVISPDSVTAPSAANIGVFTISGSPLATFSDSFMLTILQSVPSAGTGIITSAIDATVSASSSGIEVSFVPSSVLIGSVDWRFFDTGLAPPSTFGGITTIEAYVATPEPGSLALAGGALVGLGLVACRRLVK